MVGRKRKNKWGIHKYEEKKEKKERKKIRGFNGMSINGGYSMPKG